MNLEKRITLLHELESYMRSEEPAWLETKARAESHNGWFIREFVDRACFSIADQFLDEQKLRQFALDYKIPEIRSEARNVGIVMAGNIPLVGFHDLLCVFLSGHRALVKTSTKDEILIKHLANKLIEWEPLVAGFIGFAELLKGCDAYIATGSNNTARYFDYYFSKYPHIIRRNRTSVAVLSGNESARELEGLSDAVNLYFGLGCRNVTKIYVPRQYEFIPLLESFNKYRYFIDHHKYRNNFDYQFAILLLDHKYYMTNGSVLVVENDQIFSPISTLHYSFYEDRESLLEELSTKEEIQCIAGTGLLPIDDIQRPSLTDYADKVDTMQFLTGI